MYRSITLHHAPRRGSALLIVLALLVLMAVLGLTFVLRAESAATSARINREKENKIGEADLPDADDYIDEYLGGMIYVVPDNDSRRTQSGFRGHELARTMYGYNSTTPTSNLSLFSGRGRITTGTVSFTHPNLGAGSANYSDVVNFGYLPGGTIVDPEWNATRTSIAGSMTGTYQNLAAPYTYPDLKDLALAVMDPTSGQILQPSYFRDYAAFGPLNPTSLNWNNSQGRLLIVRPRPADHVWDSGDGRGPVSDFPYPPMNPDGTYTGDVQNFRYPNGQQKMDSIWIYPGGPVKTWNGRRYTACIAPLVLDLNGRVDLSVAGNNVAGPGHASGSGVGPHEINPTRVFNPSGVANDAASITALQQLLLGNAGINGRYIPGPAVPLDRLTNLPIVAFNGGNANTDVPPSYARVDYNNVPGAGTLMQPIGTTFSPFPIFSSAKYYDTSNVNTELTNHPAQVGPEYWPSILPSPLPPTIKGRTFEAKDMHWLATRYGDQPGNYNRADTAKLASMLSTSTSSAADNIVRQLVTTESSTIWRPEIEIPGAQTTANSPVRLGPIDLNRPLPDYRSNTSNNYGPDNITSATSMTAQLERQRFARDIYVRLVAAAGGFASGAVQYQNALPNNDTSGYGYPVVTPTNQTYLQSFAQLAVNIVDYIDRDDVATVFTWNPNATVTLSAGGYPLGTDSTNLGNSVVFGTELNRVVLNEVFAELGNARADYNPAMGTTQPPENPAGSGRHPAAQNFRKRFWIELCNPLSVTPNADPNMPESGLARLHYPAGSFGGSVPVAYSPYMVSITKYAANAIDDPANTTGSPRHSTAIAAGATVQMVIDKYQYDATDMPEAMAQGLPITLPGVAPYTSLPYTSPAGMQGEERYVIHPQGDGTPTAERNLGGYCVIGPPGNFPGQNTMGAPGTPAATIRLLQQAPDYDSAPTAMNANTLELDVGTHDETNIMANLTPTSVYLRRLANPYLPPNDPFSSSTAHPFNPAMPLNPYITVDRAENITPVNNVRFGSNDKLPTTPDLTMMASTGRQHPYAGAQAARANQTSSVAMTDPKQSFFARNDNVPAAPAQLNWLTHLDRQLLNPLEVVSVSATTPHALTEQFYTILPAPGYNRHTAESAFLPGLMNGSKTFAGSTLVPEPVPYMPPTAGQLYAGFLHAALDLLTTRPHYTGVPVGGRQKGLVNVNTIWHQNVLRAVLDANGNNHFTEADVTAMYTQLTQPTGANARSRSSTPYNTNINDRPIHGLLSQFQPGMLPVQDSIFRNVDGTATTPPIFYTSAGSLTPAPTGDPTHAWGVTEPLKKMWNSTTTVSNNFLVIMTVGFFEVRHEDTNGRIYLGKELFNKTPGDLRDRYVAVIDRTGIACDITNPSSHANAEPWFTTTLDTIQPGTPTATTFKVAADATGNVYVGGKAVSLTGLAGQPLWLGYGSAAMNGGDGEPVTIASVTPGPAGSGYATITLSMPGAQNYHPAGSPLSNVLLGNPGPEPGFDPAATRYKSVVKYFAKMQPGE